MPDNKDFFIRAFNYTMQNECSNSESCKFTDDPADSGGPTNFGIATKTLATWLNRPVSKADVESLNKETAADIMKHLYWEKLECGKIACYQIAAAIFDAGVLFGVKTSAKIAQRTLQLSFDQNVDADGVIGERTIQALNAVNPFAFINTFKLLLLHRIDDIVSRDSKNSKFLNGWNNRINRLKDLF